MSDASNGFNNNVKTAISIRDVKKSFGKVKALDGASFDARMGEIFGILGPDGAGKTTLMRILAGLMPFDGGRVDVLGYDLSSGPSNLCDHIAYMPQRFGLYEDLTVMENIFFYADLYDMSRGAALDARVDELLNFCRMAPFKNRKAGKLSGGMKQKLSLTCALIHTPKLLLLDEPTNGVDPVSRREFWKILHNMLAGGVTIFVSTTYLDEAERCNRVAFINNGRITGIDTPKGLKSSSKYKMWKLEVSDKFAAIERVQKVPGVASAFIMGTAIHIFTGSEMSPPVLTKSLHGELDGSGIDFLALAEVRPNLEDIFIEQMGA